MPKLILSQNFVEVNTFTLTASTYGRKGYSFHFPKEEQRLGGCAWSVPEQKQGHCLTIAYTDRADATLP